MAKNYPKTVLLYSVLPLCLTLAGGTIEGKLRWWRKKSLLWWREAKWY